jgi:flagellar basal body-associated protein FliL
VLWLLCISCLAYVYFPDRLKFHTNSPTEIEKVTVEVSRKKSLRLKIGSVIFVAALAATSISIVWLGAQPSKETQMEELTIHLAMTQEEKGLLNNMSERPEETQRILPIVLSSLGNQTYLVQTPSRSG